MGVLMLRHWPRAWPPRQGAAIVAVPRAKSGYGPGVMTLTRPAPRSDSLSGQRRAAVRAKYNKKYTHEHIAHS